MKFISNKRFIICSLGFAVSALAAKALIDALFFGSALFEYITAECIKSGTDFLECAYEVRFSASYILGGAFLACAMSYFWYRVLTAKAKELHYDVLIAMFISILIVRILFSGGIQYLWSNIGWSLIYTSGAIMHFFNARRIINKALKEDSEMQAAS